MSGTATAQAGRARPNATERREEGRAMPHHVEHDSEGLPIPNRIKAKPVKRPGQIVAAIIVVIFAA